jgi:hypothetical protein
VNENILTLNQVVALRDGFAKERVKVRVALDARNCKPRDREIIEQVAIAPIIVLVILKIVAVEVTALVL